MFTGLIESVGTVQTLKRSDQGWRMDIRTGMAPQLTEGDSIAVNGICLTARQCSPDGFSADVMPETAACVQLELWRTGKFVNLERALAAQGRLDGHLVSGHVDDTGKIRSVRRDSNAFRITVSAAPSLLDGIIPKGSVALDGISLTVINCSREEFTVGVIPHTYTHTALQKVAAGDTVNIETDMIGKYVFSWLQNQSADMSLSSLTKTLAENGYFK